MFDYTFTLVASSATLLGLVCGVLGCFFVLQKQALIGDALSHATLPGVVAVFLLCNTKRIELLLLGAACAALCALLLLRAATHAKRIPSDAVLALVVSVFFGFGLVLLSIAQAAPNARQAGLKSFIYGQASSLLPSDLVTTLICCIVLLGLVALFWKQLFTICCDAVYARVLGMPLTALRIGLDAALICTIVIGLQMVGVILLSALLIGPAVAARQWTHRLSTMVCLAGSLGAFSGCVGTLFSSLVPRIPTGPCIALCVSMLVLISVAIRSFRCQKS